MKLLSLIWCSLLGALLALPASAVVQGEIDDFQVGFESWQGGGGTGSVLSRPLNGGFYGSGDHCLQITATGGNLGTNNITQWTGDYLAAQVAKVGFHLNNTGATPLALRLNVFGSGGTFTTQNAIVVPPASGWVSVEFGLDGASLVYNGGGGTGQLADTLANVSTLLIRHDPDPISQSSQANPVIGQLRIDNIRALPLSSIALSQSDDFQDGTVEAWAGVASPTNMPSGGPGGIGDRYLQIGASGAQLGSHNSLQWRGDYLAAQIAKIRFHLNNTGLDPLALRITVFGKGGAFTTTNETVIPPASGWVLVDFSLAPGSLTQTTPELVEVPEDPQDALTETLANVTTMLIRHDPDPIDPPGVDNNVTGTLGIDNVTALPEPGWSLSLIAGVVALALIYRFDRYATGHGRAARATAPSCRGRRSALSKRGVSS